MVNIACSSLIQTILSVLEFHQISRLSGSRTITAGRESQLMLITTTPKKMLTLILAICLVTGCMEFSNVQAATGKSGTTYYDTCINGKKGGTITTNGTKYYMSGTRKAICKGNTLTMYASFNTSKNRVLNSQNKKAYIKYGKHTFKLTSKTKYYFSGGEAPNQYCSKSAFMSTMRSMNGLGLCIKVTNGKVVEMSFNS